jgi:hypothetical protein
VVDITAAAASPRNNRRVSMELTVMEGIQAVREVADGRVRLALVYVKMWGTDVVVEVPANPYEFKVRNLAEVSPALHNRVVAQLYTRLRELSETQVGD